MKIEFTKMHGLGNDMIVIDGRGGAFIPTAGQARWLCNRRLGIGADQILLLAESDQADFRMRIWNGDGSEVEMCGNGIRCLARYIRSRGISDKNPLEIETPAGVIRPEIMGDMVRVDMGEPVFEASRIPVRGEGKIRDVEIMAGGRSFRMSAVSMGNPHCVIVVDDVRALPMEEIGPKLENHEWFPRRVNIEFVEVVDRSHIKVRVWERGAGATLACGTGACAAAVVMMDQGRIERKAMVGLPGGDLEIEWDGRVWMTGPAEEVFTGVVDIREED